MRTSRINTPLNKQIDEWVFHFNGKSVRYLVHIKRRRDPESGETGPGALGLASFHAYFDRKYWTDQGKTMDDLGFPFGPVSGYDYNEVFEKVKATVWSAKDQAWDEVIVVGSKGVDRLGDEDKVKFTWGRGYRSKDGTLYRDDERKNYVTRRPVELLPGGLSFNNEDIVVYPYSPELENSLKELDAMFGKFNTALRFVLKNPDMLLGIKNKLLPLTVPEEPDTVEKKSETTVDGIKL